MACGSSGRRWLPEAGARAIVEIAHGLAEHSARYARLAAALTSAGYGVYAMDLRGHGPAAAKGDLGHFADADGWAKCVGDLWTLNRQIAAEQPGVPIVFLGHSMGSFLGRQFVAEHSDALAGAAYSGSNGKPPPIASLGRLIAHFERLRLGKRGKSALLNQMMFGDFNKPFGPARTEFDWLSRDPAEVDAYVADPLCGFPFTTQLAVDLLDALPYFSGPARLPAFVGTCRSTSFPASAIPSAPISRASSTRSKARASPGSRLAYTPAPGTRRSMRRTAARSWPT